MNKTDDLFLRLYKDLKDGKLFDVLWHRIGKKMLRETLVKVYVVDDIPYHHCEVIKPGRREKYRLWDVDREITVDRSRFTEKWLEIENIEGGSPAIKVGYHPLGDLRAVQNWKFGVPCMYLAFNASWRVYIGGGYPTEIKYSDLELSTITILIKSEISVDGFLELLTKINLDIMMTVPEEARVTAVVTDEDVTDWREIYSDNGVILLKESEIAESDI